MICRNCLRQCRAAAGSLTRLRPTYMYNLDPVGLPRRSVQTFAPAHDAQSVGDNATDLFEDSEAFSPFKKQRLQDLRSDRESESPLYTQSYPRITPSESRMAIREFYDMQEDLSSDRPIVTLYGRIRAKRVAGSSLLFIDIVNEFRKVQVMVNKSYCLEPSNNICTHNTKKFFLWTKLIQVGDHISVKGFRAKTKTGAWILEARELPILLSPSLEQIPQKLTDRKSKIQERHVDMLVNRSTTDILRLRSEITKHMRDHFHSKRFLEFQTPILAENAGGATARPFVTRAVDFGEKNLALRVAPELWLKRLVVGGVDKIFEIGPAFRNEGVDATHNPEFTMCEFYSAYTSLSELISETEELISSLARHCKQIIETELLSLPPIDLLHFKKPFQQIEFVPALEEATGIRFPNLSAEGALPEMLAVLKLAGIDVPGDIPNSLPKLLDRLAAIYIEPKSFEKPILIINHPACMSPLAKSFLCPKTYQLVSARAELFVGSREVANMYEEENDPAEQKRKLMAHRNLVNQEDGSVGVSASALEGTAANQSEDLATWNMHQDEDELGEIADDKLEQPRDDDEWATSPLDRSYIKALDYALPPTGGWGCGVDRLVMLFSGASRISDCLSFGTVRNVVGLSAADAPKAKKASKKSSKSRR